MANSAHVKALIQSHADGDEERFFSVALQMAAQEARLGHAKFAQELRDLVVLVRSKHHLSQHSKPIPIVQPQGELAGLLLAAYPKARLGDMVLDRQVRAQIEEILLEQRQRENIREHGYQPLRKLLLLGPPGTGKTMTALVLAGELALPLFTIQIDGLITKFLGETSAKLRLIFEAISETRGVYLFDEFDAVGGERSARNDVGEIRRVLNSFLQFLEQEDSDSLIVAATNHPNLLDRALFRRFDSVLRYSLPAAQIAESIMRARLGLAETKDVDWRACARESRGLSHGDIARACELAAKRAILRRTTRVATADVVAALVERRMAHHDEWCRRRE